MITYLIGYLIGGIIFGLITQYVAESKGYNGGFWWGFFLGLIGLLVVGFRPNINTSPANASQRPSSNSDSSQYWSRISACNVQKTWTCICGEINSDKLQYCTKCRIPRVSGDVSINKIECPYCHAMNNKANTVCFACSKSIVVESDKHVISEAVPIAVDQFADTLREISKLHDQGILNDEEYSEKKASILAKM